MLRPRKINGWLGLTIIVVWLLAGGGLIGYGLGYGGWPALGAIIGTLMLRQVTWKA